jgi:ribonuclease HII
MLLHEEKARAQGYVAIAGVDEAGRGPLAGPVVAAACMLPPDFRNEEVDDSKKLTPRQRFELYHQLTSDPSIVYGLGIVDAIVIDQINILQATFQAMLIAVSQLKKRPDFLLVDGNLLPPFDIPAVAIVEGDSQSLSIASASIIAKYTRDQIMLQYHSLWPQYGFDAHKGYGTRQHLLALDVHGACPIHRTTFAPIKSLN